MFTVTLALVVKFRSMIGQVTSTAAGGGAQGTGVASVEIRLDALYFCAHGLSSVVLPFSTGVTGTSRYGRTTGEVVLLGSVPLRIPVTDVTTHRSGPRA